MSGSKRIGEIRYVATLILPTARTIRSWSNGMVDIRTKAGSWRSVVATYSGGGEIEYGTVRAEGNSNAGRFTRIPLSAVAEARGWQPVEFVPIEQIPHAHVVVVSDRLDGVYVFAEEADAREFEEAVNGDQGEAGPATYAPEPVCSGTWARELINDEKED